MKLCRALTEIPASKIFLGVFHPPLSHTLFALAPETLGEFICHSGIEHHREGGALPCHPLNPPPTPPFHAHDPCLCHCRHRLRRHRGGASACAAQAPAPDKKDTPTPLWIFDEQLCCRSQKAARRKARQPQCLASRAAQRRPARPPRADARLVPVDDRHDARRANLENPARQRRGARRLRGRRRAGRSAGAPLRRLAPHLPAHRRRDRQAIRRQPRAARARRC